MRGLDPVQRFNARENAVRVADLRAWCLKHNRRLDGAARSEFVAQLLRSRYGGAAGSGGA